jgi:ATP-dependent Clp protease ATP-binding subunit ClpA
MSAPSQVPRSPSIFSFHSASSPVQTPVKHPRLFFAIAASQPGEVARLLQTGEADANDTVGPEDMHALEFAVESLKDGNESDLSKKEEIVTTLLSYGADPLAVKNEGNAYVKYFLDKATKSPVIPEEVKNQDAMEEAPLARARFVIVGQEYGVMELVRSYRAHMRLARYLADDETELPFVALLTGPSGHGKTHLATRSE